MSRYVNHSLSRGSDSALSTAFCVFQVITVLTSPYPEVDGVRQAFSCAWNCHYCPQEPGQPRSYLHDEPAVRRANQNGFDAVLQFTDRAATLVGNGHPLDKVELLVLGGTWASYQHAYQEAFVRDLFYAANTFWHRGTDKRPRRSLAEEQAENESGCVKIIGLTLETRPDTITADELRRLRRFGCTRVQLGVQHTDKAVLASVNRGHGPAAVIKALQLLKDTCYKVDVHLMPNLPGCSPALDAAMFQTMTWHPDWQADQWKIYPCEVLPWTRIKEWFDSGKFVPYSDEELFEVILDAKADVRPWVRLNRVIRDIPSQYILGGVDAPNMRQTLAQHLAARGLACKCIRCREAGAAAAELADKAVLKRRTYDASGGIEHFLSFETPDEAVIFGFVRLRFCANPGVGLFQCLAGAGLIRELHVYGQLVPSLLPSSAAPNSDASLPRDAAQHTGFGRRLMAAAEELAASHGCVRTAVIAGVGARGYYRKLGYDLTSDDDGGFMVKDLPRGLRLRKHILPRCAYALAPFLAALLLLLLHAVLPQPQA